jgi:hypothetical protein
MSFDASSYNITGLVKEDLHSMAISPDRLLARAGDRIKVLTIYCHNGPYSCRNLATGKEFCVPRSWLVECGALEPLAESPDSLKEKYQKVLDKWTSIR